MRKLEAVRDTPDGDYTLSLVPEGPIWRCTHGQAAKDVFCPAHAAAQEKFPAGCLLPKVFEFSCEEIANAGQLCADMRSYARIISGCA